jgi:hypothetical protein
LYVDSGNAATGLKVGLYSDNGGVPGTLLASGSVTSPASGAWNTATLSSGATINAGTVYWLAFLGTGGTLSFLDQGSGSCSQSHSATGLSALPGTWSPGTNWPSCLASAYVSAPTATPTPSATPGSKVGDINGDGQVNIFDLSTLLSKWGTSGTPADLNNDGTVNIFDLSILLSHWGS